jgi:competence protein ComEA
MKYLTILVMLAAVAISADEKEIKALPEGPGKQAVVKACLECHGAATFRKARKDPDEWSDTIDEMIDRGAKVKTADVEAIVAYMKKHFGKDAKVQMNSAPIEEIKVVLDFSVPEANAIVDYREAHGPYQDWRAVARVPGLDVARVESKKELMAF